MSGVLERSLAILEALSDAPDGLSLGALAQRLDQPPSGVHRLLADLVRLGYVRQERAHGDYQLTIRLASLGLGFLARTGITDVSQPVLDDLAGRSGELVRLSLFDGESLVWVGVAQGATTGLRFDPGREQGVVVHLASSAGGQAWLAAMSDEEALAYVAAQGVAREGETQRGPPRTIAELLRILAETRRRGYSIAIDSYHAGMAAMATAVRRSDGGPALGALSIAGPTVRFTRERMDALAGPLVAAARELAAAGEASRYFGGRGRASARAQREGAPR